MTDPEQKAARQELFRFLAEMAEEQEATGVDDSPEAVAALVKEARKVFPDGQRPE